LSKSKIQVDQFAELKNLLSSSKRILLSTHALPDGDGLGAESALFHYLKRAKKSVRVYNPDRLPPRYGFLDPKDCILMGPGEVEIWDTFDLWIIVDTHDPRRLNKLWGELSLRAKKILFIDHHPEVDPNQEIHYPPHASTISDTTSSSIGEMLYKMIHEFRLTKLNKDIATGIYVSIMTDTNSFRYAGTTPASHRIAGEMIELGVNAEEIYQSIYSSKEVSHLRLLGNLLQNVDATARGKIAWVQMDLNLRKKFRASSDDTQSFLNFLLLLRDAEIVCLFREEDNGRIRVSMKSKGKVVINTVAAELGGGGHDFAAGFEVSAPLQTTIKTLISRLKKALEASERFKK